MKLGDLLEWEKNPVQISEREAKELAKSLERFEHVLPYVAAAPPNGHKGLPLLDGHQRKMVEITLLKTPPSTMVDVRIPSRKLTEKERQELAVRLRKNTGTFDFDKLSEFFDTKDLLDWGFTEKELSSEGFEFGEPKDAEPQIDRAEELQKKWKVKTGDLWQIGTHRLLCGDSTKREDVEQVMGGERAQMCFTDPPYGVNFADAGGTSIEGDISYAIIPLFFATILEILDDRAWLYVCGGQTHMALFSKMFEHYLKQIPKTIVWDKLSPIMRRNGYQSSFEFVYYGFTKGAGDWWFGSRAGEEATDVWHVAVPSGEERTHLTQKPVELPQRAINNTCPKDGIVYEPFNGTGAVLVACENLGRKCRAIEISPAYCAVTLERMSQAFPGIEIRRIDGKSGHKKKQ